MRACLPFARGRGDRADLVDEPAPQREGRDEELAELLRLSEAGDVVEEVGDVRRDVLVRGEDSEILVEPGRRRVVVAGPDVCVSAELVALATDDQRHLRVDLEVGKPVRDVDARLLELSRPLDVAELVEACLQLDEARTHRFPSSAHWISEPTSTLSSLVRYTAVFMAMTSGSRTAAWANTSKLAMKEP